MSENNYPSSRYAWYMVVMMTLAYVLSFVDRYVLGLLIEPIKADLGLTDTQIGILLGPSFLFLYLVMGFVFGYLADRARRTYIVAVGVFIWSLATAASGLAKSFTHLIFARLTIGAGEAALGPCAMSMISDSFPREKRGRPIAFYTMALSLGAGLASLLSAGVLAWANSEPSITMPIVGTVSPWQFTFFIVGIPGIFMALIMLTLREPKRRLDESKGVKPRLRDLLKHVGNRWKVYASFLAFVCFMTIVAYSQGFYAPMFSRTWGWEAQTYALVNGIVLLAVGPLTVNVAGWANDHYYAKGVTDAPLNILIIGVLLIIPTGILAPLMPTPELAMVLIALNTIGIATASATGITGLLNITPSAIRGQVVALYYIAISLTGLGLGPTTIGVLSDRVFGNENLNLAAATLPAIYGLPLLILIPFARRLYKAELARQAAL